jgi:hypothetical protein
MYQISICLFLALKGLSTRTVDSELAAVLGADPIVSSIVTKYLYQRQFTSILVGPPSPHPAEEPTTIIIDQAILDAFEQ